MTRELAKYLTALVADDIDSRSCLNEYMSNYECDRLTAMFVKENFSAIQEFLEHNLDWDKLNETEL